MTTELVNLPYNNNSHQDNRSNNTRQHSTPLAVSTPLAADTHHLNSTTFQDEYESLEDISSSWQSDSLTLSQTASTLESDLISTPCSPLSAASQEDQRNSCFCRSSRVDSVKQIADSEGGRECDCPISNDGMEVLGSLDEDHEKEEEEDFTLHPFPSTDLDYHLNTANRFPEYSQNIMSDGSYDMITPYAPVSPSLLDRCVHTQTAASPISRSRSVDHSPFVRPSPRGRRTLSVVPYFHSPVPVPSSLSFSGQGREDKWDTTEDEKEGSHVTVQEVCSPPEGTLEEEKTFELDEFKESLTLVQEENEGGETERALTQGNEETGESPVHIGGSPVVRVGRGRRERSRRPTSRVRYERLADGHSGHDGEKQGHSHSHSHSHSHAHGHSHHSHAHHHHHSHPHQPKTHHPPFDPYTASLPDLVTLLKSNQTTSLEIVRTYLKVIEKHNPTLRALTWVRERQSVEQEAIRMDESRLRKGVDWEKTPMWGVPIVVKDNIATDEELGMPTTAGSFALLGMPVKKDAFIVAKLRKAGAIILGKANMSELADYKSQNAGPGWSAVGGQTINVYAPHASPGTSSAGNGVAVAAGFCPASIGTETDGSITLPCLQSCLYGLKPTVGVLSRAGIVPFAPYFDTPGPMAKDVESLALLMDVMHGSDEEDEKSLEVERIPRGVKYVDSVKKASFEGLRIGVPRQNWHEIDPWQRQGRDELVPEISNAFETAIRTMSGLGAVMTDPADIPSAVDGSLWACAAGSRSLVVAADCNEYLGRYLKNLGGEGGCRSVADIIAFNEEHADIEMPPGHHGQEVLKRCLTAVSVDSEAYAQAKAEMKMTAGIRGLEAVMDEYDLDALFMIREGHHSLANMVGCPIAAVPIGLLCDNTPFGAYFIGRRHGEQTLLRIMAAWESALGARPLPPIAH